jgi:hypothetical protein
MDLKTLVVGQDVYMVSGRYGNKGKVVEVTPSSVIVQLALAHGPIDEPTLIRFDKRGRACDSSDIYNGNMWGSSPRIPGTHEFGPWKLTDVEVPAGELRWTKVVWARSLPPVGPFWFPIDSNKRQGIEPYLRVRVDRLIYIGDGSDVKHLSVPKKWSVGNSIEVSFKKSRFYVKNPSSKDYKCAILGTRTAK